MSENKLQNRWALITGASAGLGADFARELAKRGCNTVLVARREQRLRDLAAELRKHHGAEAEVERLDLQAPDAAASLHRRLQDRGRHIDILINNAGVGTHGSFLDISWEKDREMLELNVVRLVQLTKLFAQEMRNRGFGMIMQVASAAAFQPVPSYASYGAAKSFVLMFGEALNYELRGTGVTCTVVCPGVTSTEFQQVAGHVETGFMRLAKMRSPDVARAGVQAMLKRRGTVVPGPHNALLAWSVRLAPRKLATALAALFMRGRR